MCHKLMLLNIKKTSFVIRSIATNEDMRGPKNSKLIIKATKNIIQCRESEFKCMGSMFLSHSSEKFVF